MRPKATAFGGHARVYTPKAQIQNENWIRMEYQKEAESRGFGGFGDKPVSVTISYFKRVPTAFSKKKRQEALSTKLKPCTKQDLDNVIKTVLDALNGMAYDDDKQVVNITAYKNFAERDYTSVTLGDGEDDVFENIGKGETKLCL